MASAVPQDPGPDAAWVTVELPVPPHLVAGLLRDPVLLLRLNPCLDFERLEWSADKTLQMSASNESNGCRVETDLTVDDLPDGTGTVLHYTAGIKRESRLHLESLSGASRLTVTEVYELPPGGSAGTPPAEVDRSLVQWAAAIRRHLVRQARFGFLPGFQWLACSFWPSMSPRHRRIAWLITWTTAVEFVVFVAVLAVYLSAAR